MDYVQNTVSPTCPQNQPRAVAQSKSPAERSVVATGDGAPEMVGKLFFSRRVVGGKGSMGNVGDKSSLVQIAESSHVNPVMQSSGPREQSSEHGDTSLPKSVARIIGQEKSMRKRRKKKKKSDATIHDFCIRDEGLLGINVTLNTTTHRSVVSTLKPDSIAERHGVHLYDHIIRVNDTEFLRDEHHSKQNQIYNDFLEATKRRPLKFSVSRDLDYTTKIDSNKKTCRRNLLRKSRTETKAIQAEAGSRLVISENIMEGEGGGNRKGGGNDRTCLMDAILSVAPQHVDTMKLKADIGENMPLKGDSSIDDVKGVLLRYGLSAKIVTREYDKKKGAAFHLFQKNNCKLLIRLILKNKEDVSMGHFVGYDGNIVYDKPEMLEINRAKDNLKSWDECKHIFGTLYPRNEFNSWQIVGVYELIGVK